MSALLWATVVLTWLCLPWTKLTSFFRPTGDPRRPSHTKSRDHAEVKARDHGITEIGVQRTRCFGSCPVYAVLLTAAGDVAYTGEAFVARLGEHHGTLDPIHFHAVAQFIRDTNFLAFEESYHREVTCKPTVYSMVVQHGQRKVVRNYAQSGPTSLWAIEQLIDQAVEHTVWDSPILDTRTATDEDDTN